MKKTRMKYLYLVSALLLCLCCGCSRSNREDALTIQTNPDAEVSQELVEETQAAAADEAQAEEAESSDAEAETTEDETAVVPEDEVPMALPEEEAAPPAIGVTTDRVNLRDGPGENHNVIRVLSSGTEVLLFGVEGEWTMVQAGEDIGYLFSAYVTETQSGSQPAAETPAQSVFQASGQVVVIDPGHQALGDSNQEPNGPGSSIMKARVTGGTRGRTTGVYEYELNLDISLQLKAELQARGYTVYMTRETHDVNMSNMERAQFAADAGADIVVRIHANGVEDSSVSGALSMAPSTSNPYCAGIAEDSQLLARCVIDAYCAATGMNNQGVSISDTMSGMNWSTVPVTILEMGYMTNPTDDTNMVNDDYQKNMVRGIADGIDAYFAQK